MADLKNEVTQLALAEGADLVGVASIGRFADVPAEHNPLSIKPDTKSVIVLGKRLLRGTLRGVEEGTHFSSFRLYGYAWLDQFLAAATVQACAYLEDRDWEAVPLLNLPPHAPTTGITVRPGEPEPNVTVDTDQAAVRAGLGEIGYCGMLFTSQYGPRQKVQLILTAAELEPDPIVTSPICDGCMLCAKSCPFGAISETGHTELGICGKVMRVARIETVRCVHCRNGASPNKYNRDVPYDRMAAICTRTCMDHLGRARLVRDVPVQPFRRREPWVAAPGIVWGPYEDAPTREITSGMNIARGKDPIGARG